MSEHVQPDRLGFRSLYGKERGTDVQFEVGPEPQLFSAHRRVLAASSPVLWAMLFGPMAEKMPAGRFSVPPPIKVVDVEPRAFKCMLRFLYGHPLELQTVPTALATLYTAHKYLCPELEWECAAFINHQLRPACVLEVLQSTSVLCPLRMDDWAPTAPPAEDDSDNEGSRLVGDPSPSRIPAVSSGTTPCSAKPACDIEFGKIGEASRRLRHNCLQLIDQHADEVLALEQVEDLDLETLRSMTSRDSLGATSELNVLRAVERWAECECRRNQSPYATSHVQRALGGARAVCGGQLVRLLHLTLEQFANGPAKSIILTPKEQRSLLLHLVGCNSAHRPATPSSPSYIDWEALARPRTPCASHYLPIPPTDACPSPQRETSPPTATKSRRWMFRWPKSKRRQSVEKSQTKQPKRPGCCSRSCEILITALACLFD